MHLTLRKPPLMKCVQDISIDLSTLSYAIHRSFTSKNYLKTSTPDHPYYVSEHNPKVFYDSAVEVPSAHRVLCGTAILTTLAADSNVSALPQWTFAISGQ